MKNIKFLFPLIAAIFLSLNIYAQHPSHHEMKGSKIEEFKADLNLTAEQESAIQKIKEKYKKERQALKGEETTDRFEMRKKMHETMRAQGDEIKNILTAEQQKILEQKIAEKQKKHFEKRQANKGKRKAMHEDFKKYRSENMLPVLLKQRAKLEEKISAEDKAKINELRPVFKNMHENRIKAQQERAGATEPLNKEEREALHEEHMKKMEQLKPQLDALHQLTEKYNDDIDALLAEIETERKTWREDMRKMHEENMGDIKKERRMKKGHRPKMDGRHMKGKEMRKGHFLLLDPNGTAAAPIIKNNIKSISVSPNPSAGANILKYELAEKGNVRIELRNERGTVLDVLFKGEKEAGQNTLEVDLSDRKNGVYYISIINGKNVVSEKFIIAK
ncbi:MAG TPA: T9SS type A sorting domain-containing protein [Bacteroidetes bacterium]|nr:T9SS type A sorting domain-containing protein [Bacteroidota bacterium]